MSNAPRRIVRYRNRKLYEPVERRFVTIHDLARAVAQGGRIEVRNADTGEDITAKILSRAIASGKGTAPASTDALQRLLRAGSEAAETVADVVEKVAGAGVAARMRRAAQPEKLAESFAPLTRRIEDARVEVERIVGGLVGRGQLTWEEGARLRDDVGAVFRDSLQDVLGRVRHLMARVGPGASPQLTRELTELKARLDQLETLARDSFTRSRTRTGAPPAPTKKKPGGRTAPARNRRN